MLWRNPAVRLLLLVLAFGVAGMHTLGHHEGHEPATAGSGHGVHTTAAAPGHPAHTAPAAHPAHGLTAVAPPTGDLDPSQMCLAILTAGALLGLAMAAGRIRRRVPVSHWRRSPRAVGRAGRGPPGPLATNLLLAEITVLRI